MTPAYAELRFLERLRLWAKWMPRCLLILLVINLSAPLVFVLSFFIPDELLAGLKNLTAKTNDWQRQFDADIERILLDRKQ